MDLKIIDAHTHVQFPEYDSDRDAVISRALEQGIGMINAGANLEVSEKGVEIAHQYANGVWATVGYHPDEASKELDLVRIEELAQDSKVVAVGECGLDYFRLEADKEDIIKKQKALFLAQIEIAHKVEKPIVIHCRTSDRKSINAFEDIIELLHLHKDLLQNRPGICHFFTGTVDIAHRFLELGFSFTFGGLITFNREFDEVIQKIPLESILIETDAPFVSPKSHRGQRNEPLYIAEVIPILASIKEKDEEEIREAVLSNTKKLFNI